MNAAHELWYPALGSWVSFASIAALARWFCPDASGRARALIWAFVAAWLFALLPVIHGQTMGSWSIGWWLRPSSLGLWTATESWSLGSLGPLGLGAQVFGVLAGLSVLLGSIRLTTSVWASVRLVQRAQEGPADLQRLVEKCASEWELKVPHVRVSSQTQVPLLVGLRRPTIVLPQALAQADDPRVALAVWHELAHLRRGDLVQHHLVAWLQVPFFLHPCAAWAADEIVLARELAVDAIVAPRAPHVYATLLLDLAGHVRAALVHGVALRPSGLSRRINAICHPQAPCPQRLWFVGAWASSLWMGAWVVHPPAANSAAMLAPHEQPVIDHGPDVDYFSHEAGASFVLPNACVEGGTAHCETAAHESQTSRDDASTSSEEGSNTLLCPANDEPFVAENTSA